MGVDTNALRWFQQVADGVTVTEVSDIERITQSGVSRALARLEGAVGAPLLHRSGRTLRLTRAGYAFKRHVDALLHELDDGLAAVSELVAPETGTVALAFQLSLGTWLVPDLVSSFRRSHPDVRFELQQLRDELAGTATAQSRADLMITTMQPPRATMRWQRLMIEPLRLAVARDHPFADRQSIDLAEAATARFISLRRTTVLRKSADELCARAGFEPDIRFEAEDLPTVGGFVAAGLGIAIMPAPHDGSGSSSDDGVRYLPIDDPLAVREIGLAWSAERRLLPSAELFRSHVVRRAAARELPGVAG